MIQKSEDSEEKDIICLQIQLIFCFCCNDFGFYMWFMYPDTFQGLFIVIYIDKVINYTVYSHFLGRSNHYNF